MSDEIELRVTSSRMWEEFLRDPRTQDFIQDLKSRRNLLVEDLVKGNIVLIPTPELDKNTDNELRKRIHEIDYAINLIDVIIADCKLAEKDRENNISDNKEIEDEKED